MKLDRSKMPLWLRQTQQGDSAAHGDVSLLPELEMHKILTDSTLMSALQRFVDATRDDAASGRGVGCVQRGQGGMKGPGGMEGHRTAGFVGGGFTEPDRWQAHIDFLRDLDEFEGTCAHAAAHLYGAYLGGDNPAETMALLTKAGKLRPPPPPPPGR